MNEPKDPHATGSPYWLVAETGPLRGKSIELHEGDTGIGRDPSNAVAILDSALSRRHLVIVREGSRFTLRDLGSRNQTLLNGKPVHEARLTEGDVVRAGASEFRFLRHLPLTQSQSGLPPYDTLPDEINDTNSIILRPSDSRYLQMVANAPGNAGRDIRDLSGLLRFARTIATVRDLDSLHETVFQAIRDLTKAEQASVILYDHADLLDFVERSWQRTGDTVRPVSKTIISRVLRDHMAILASDVPADITGAESLVLTSVRTLVAVPMGQSGVLYMDSLSQTHRFDNQDLELACAIGNITALALANLHDIQSLVTENERLREDLGLTHDIVGESPAIRTVLQHIAKASAADSNVLVLGESGTGKELVARAIHFNSDRSLRPFIAINCASIPETLIESELFGHEKGAFTHAMVQKKGKFELAHGGTIFLDEIGELSPALQAKLLRVIQEREIEHLGGSKPIKIDVRIIAATHRDLKEMVRSNGFRQDLYFRLNVIPIRMPALRERAEDIPLLANYFLDKFKRQTKRRVIALAPKARDLLTRYDWPGNVRELENAIERAVVMGMTEYLLPEDFPEMLESVGHELTDQPDTLQAVMHEAKRRAILRALELSSGNQIQAAQILDIHPVHLSKTIKALGLKSKRARI